MQDDEKVKIVQNNIVYIGSDQKFFENVKEQLKKMVKTVDFHFETWFSDDPKVIQSYILKNKEVKPKAFIVDQSLNEDSILHFARTLQRENTLTKVPLLSVIDYSQGKISIFKAVMSKIKCIHVKGQEFEAICYDLLNFVYPDKVENHRFVTAELNEMIRIFHPGKVNIINENFLKCESDFSFELKQPLRLKNFWENRKIIKTDLSMLIKEDQKNIYYDYKFSQVFQLAHAEAVVRTDTMTDDDYNYRQKKRTKDINQSRADLGTWIIENKKYSNPKLIKVLSIDKDHHFYNLQPLTNKYSFQLRNEPFLQNTQIELLKYTPKIIIFNLEIINEETLKSNEDIAYSYNDSRKLQHLIKCCREMFPQNPPVILCFNSQERDTKYFQANFSYKNIMAIQDEFTAETGLKLIQSFVDKISANMKSPKDDDVYIPRGSDLSYIEIEDEITIKGCSENDIYFNSTKSFSNGHVFRLNLPVPMYITVVEKPNWTIVKSQYYGIIHGIGTKERQSLRRFINSVFFRDLDLAKAKDEEEVENLKLAYIKKQQDAIEKARLEKEASEEKKAIDLDAAQDKTQSE